MAKKRDYATDIKPNLILLGYTIISKDEDYINMTTNLTFKCSECENNFLRTPKSALKCVPTCQKCTQKTVVSEKLHHQKMDDEEFKAFMDNLNVEYSINGGYAHLNCEECGKHLSRRWYVIKYSKYPTICNGCASAKKGGTLTKHIVNEKLCELESTTKCIENGNFTYKTRVKFQCECGNIFVRKSNTVLSQRMWRCNECSKKISKGEHRIMKYLTDNNINYIYQKSFDDCANVLPLYFDFYIEDWNLIIEYDGEYHYFDKFGGLEIQTFRDNIKNEYCVSKNINIIRIPYYEFDNISRILDEYFTHGNIVLSHPETDEKCND